jgi:folate-binding protein YgfZ
MKPGQVARSFLLEPRGKLRAILWVLMGADQVGLVADRGVGPTAATLLERFRFRVDAAIRLDDRPIVALWGPETPAVLVHAGLPVPEGWAVATDGAVVASIPAGVPRFLVVGGADLAGARPIGSIAATTVRIEAGEPVMGQDATEATIPQETGLVPAAVSFTKGCYVGQELVARIDSRGHVNRLLRGIVLRETVVPPVGADVVHGGEVVGALSSVGESLTLRAPIALGTIRREVDPGTEVEIRWPGGAASAEVRALPLDDFTVDVS